MLDIIIIGGGPAGLTAAIYALRQKKSVLVITKHVGGRAVLATEIENYPGYIKISGHNIMRIMEEQVKLLGGEIILGNVSEIKKLKNFIIKLDNTNKSFNARRVILATGGEDRKLGVKGEEEFLGKGVSYCATCDSSFFKGKTVCVVGGGDSAVHAVKLLSKIAKKVYLIHRRKNFRCSEIEINRLKNKKNVEFLLDEEVKEIKGKEKVEEVVLKNLKIKTDGVFIEIGVTPLIGLAKQLGVKLDRELIVVNDLQETNVKGFYAAGDITVKNGNLKQIITAACEGAVAGFFASQSLDN